MNNCIDHSSALLQQQPVEPLSCVQSEMSSQVLTSSVLNCATTSCNKSSTKAIQSANTEETVMMQAGDGFSSAASSYIKLSTKEIEDLREAFRLFDADGKGVISFQELKEVADALALENGNQEDTASNHSFRQMSDILCSINAEEEMELDEDAFIRLMSHRPQDDSRDEYQRMYDLFDTKGKGYISLQDLRKVSEDLGETMTDEELDEMITKAAPSTGKVTIEEFQNIMTRRLYS